MSKPAFDPHKPSQAVKPAFNPNADYSAVKEQENAAPTEAPYGLQTIDTLISHHPWSYEYGAVKSKADALANAAAEEFPTAAAIGSGAMMAISPLATLAKYGTLKGLQAAGVKDPESLNLAKFLPKSSARLHINPDVTDIAPTLLMAKGAINPSAGEGMLSKGLRRSYNASVDPIGSLIKFPEWQKEQTLGKAYTAQEQFKKEIADKIEQERPAPLTGYEAQIAEMRRNNNQLPIQEAAETKFKNAQRTLADTGMTNANFAKSIVNAQNYGLTDPEVMYLSQHPDFMGDKDIQRMAQNIQDRPAPMTKPTLAEGGSRTPQKSFVSTETPPAPTETMTVPEHYVDAAQMGLVPDDQAGLYSTKQPVPQQLRKIVEQPPLSNNANERGTHGGPVIIGEHGALIHPNYPIPEGVEPPSLGNSTYTAEGVAVPKYELNPQENIDTSVYPAEPNIPEDAYRLRQRADEGAAWKYNKQGVKEAGKDEVLGSIASRLRNKYQQSSERLPRNIFKFF